MALKNSKEGVAQGRTSFLMHEALSDIVAKRLVGLYAARVGLYANGGMRVFPASDHGFISMLAHWWCS